MLVMITSARRKQPRKSAEACKLSKPKPSLLRLFSDPNSNDLFTYFLDLLKLML